MKAWVVTPGYRNSTRLVDRDEPELKEGSLLVEMMAVGVCGTDHEIIEGNYGVAPPGRSELVLGHESIGRVLNAPVWSSFKPGDWVAPIVRRPDPVPCENCSKGQWDMCLNGLYTERGIKERDGFCSERYRIEPEYAIPVEASLGELGVLVEPASVVAKAWQQIEYFGKRSNSGPKRALITGAGPIGLLAALMARQRDLQVQIVDRAESGIKPELARLIGAKYSTQFDASFKYDVALECTGSDQLALDLISTAGPDSIICLTGVSSGARKIKIDLGSVNRNFVLENALLFGSVNARREHYEAGAETLFRANKSWLSKLITRKIPLHAWRDALVKSDQDVKTIIVPMD